jgi:hypothetical protein
MDRKAYDDFDDHEKKVQDDADDEGAIDFLQVYGMMMVTEAMCVIMVVSVCR